MASSMDAIATARPASRRFHRPLPEVEVVAQRTDRAARGRLFVLPFRRAKGRQFEVDRPPRQGVGHPAHVKQVGGPGQQKITRRRRSSTARFTASSKDGVRCTSSSVTPGAEQSVGIPLRLVLHPEIIQCEIGPAGSEGFDQGGLTRLPRPSHDRHGQHFQGGLQVSDKPTWTNVVHAVK